MSRFLRLATQVSLLAALASVVLNPQSGRANVTPADPPLCRGCPQREYYLNSFVSLTEGNVGDTYSVAQVRSAFGPTLDFQLIYNSYDADGSRNMWTGTGASIDTVMGYGWTHTYNDLLFTQHIGDMFRLGPDGRITRFTLQNDGSYQTSPGYFETLVKNNDGSFDLTTKYHTDYHYASVPGTPFQVDGPVQRLISITDRNNNVTSLTYDATGNLITITDTYGRSFSLSYNPNHHLASVVDPAGNATTFSYNAAGNLLMTINDPNNKTTSYTYNAFRQITSKTDRDGRVFTYSYQHNLPYSELDGNGNPFYSLTNTSNWAIDPVQMFHTLLRVYIPSTTSKTDGRNNVWKYSYDSNAHPLSVVAPDGATTMYSYDPATLQVASMTDANGHTTQYTYDAQGNLLTRTDAYGNVTKYTYDLQFSQLTSMTDPQGRLTKYTLDSSGNRITETDPLGNTMQWTYDPHGNVTSSTDKNGYTTNNTYDAYGNLMMVTDPLIEVTKYSYDIMGNKTSMTDADGNVTQYQYDALYRLTVVTDALLHTKQYFYDNEGDKVKFVDENNHTATYIYDLRQRLVSVLDAGGGTTTYTYDGNENKTSLTDQNTHTTQYAYDAQNRLMTVTDALLHTTQYTYDGVGNLQCETDANGHQTCYAYDSLNRRTQKKDAAGEVTMWLYDQTGLPNCPVPPGPCSGPTLGSSLITEQIDGNGKVVYYVYDGLDRLIIEIHKQGCSYSCPYKIDPNDAVTYYSYDPNSNRLTWQQPDGNITNYFYDKVNRQIKMVQVQTGDTTLTTYDPVGNALTVTAPDQNVTTYNYDPLNRRISEADLDGPVSTTSYDPVGNVIGTTDGDGNLTTYTYDALNRRVTTTDPLGSTTQYFYDPVGNLTKVIDRDLNPTTYTYDAVNRRLTVTNAINATTKYFYDPVGNVSAITNANGDTTTFIYDPVNRKMDEIYPDKSKNTVAYTYDNVGNVLTRTDQESHVTYYVYSDLYFLTSRTYSSSSNADSYTYDLSGRVLTGTRTTTAGSWTDTYAYDGSDRVIQSDQNGETITYAYDIPGRTRTVTYPGGRVITEQKDFRDSRILSVNDGGSTPIVQYTYDPADNVLTRGYRNGTVETETYNANNWPCSIMDTDAKNKLIAGFDYAYDNEGNKFYEDKLHAPGDSQLYTNDSVYRLTDYKVGTLNGTPDCVSNMSITATSDTTYILDKLGNWDKIVTTPGGTQTRSFGPSNEITSINGKLDINDADGDEDLSYDGAERYAYDEEQRLVQATAKNGGKMMEGDQYDAFGRRVSEIDSSGNQVFYYYDGWRSVEEEAPDGTPQATYVFGDALDEALTMDRVNQPGPFYFHQNNLESVFVLTDSTGKGVEGYSYDAYGYQTVILPGPDGILDFDSDDIYLPGGKSAYGNPFLFTGQRYDPEADLFYYKNRYYSTTYGRFMSRDPEDYDAGDENLYEYVGGRPTYDVDPVGTQPRLPGEMQPKPKPTTSQPQPKLPLDYPSAKLKKLIEDLDNDEYTVREKAKTELTTLVTAEVQSKKYDNATFLGSLLDGSAGRTITVEQERRITAALWPYYTRAIKEAKSLPFRLADKWVDPEDTSREFIELAKGLPVGELSEIQTILSGYHYEVLGGGADRSERAEAAVRKILPILADLEKKKKK